MELTGSIASRRDISGAITSDDFDRGIPTVHPGRTIYRVMYWTTTRFPTKVPDGSGNPYRL